MARMSFKNIAWLHSLRGRLIVVLLAVGLIPVAIVDYMAYRAHENTYVELAGKSLSETAHTITQLVDHLMFERWGDAQAFPRSSVFQTMEAGPMRVRLAELVEIYAPNYVLIAIADPAGKIVASSRAQIEGTDVRGEQWFRDTAGGKVPANRPLFQDLHQDSLLEAATGEKDRAWAMTLTSPIERDGQVVGVLHMVCDWAVIQKLVGVEVKDARDEGSRSTEMRVIRRDGVILYSSKDAELMQGTDRSRDLIRRSGDGKAASARLPADGEGDDLIAGWAVSKGASDFPGVGWTVVGTRAVGEARAAALDAAKRSIVVTALVALAILFVAIFIANYLIRPLDMMAGTLHNLATSEADLSRRLPTERSDELGFVSRSFNTFVDNLQRMIDQVVHSGMQVTMSTTQIAAGSRQLEASVAEQVAATNEVVATTNEIAATANDLSSTMSAVAQMSEETAAAAKVGQRDLQHMAESVVRMEEATQAVSARLAVINDKAGNISTVVTTITKVADQTNLLSLNAAIEAEKAGQFGQGFAVVAREIRRLADQTAVATLDIEKMVKEMKSAVSSGVMSMEKLNEQVRHSVETVRQVGSHLEMIVTRIQEVAPKFEAAHVGMQAQFQGAQQISQAMGQLSETTQQTALALRDANRAIVELNDAAGSLQSMFSRFKLTEAMG